MQNPTLDDYDFDKLGKLDSMGYDWEMHNLNYLQYVAKQDGFKITFHNPTKPHLWKRTKQNGIDLKLEVKTRDGIPYTFWIEESYMSHSYYYRKHWFTDCRVPRFRNVPVNRFNIKVILTNQPSNMLSKQRFLCHSCKAVFYSPKLVVVLTPAVDCSKFDSQIRPHP